MLKRILSLFISALIVSATVGSFAFASSKDVCVVNMESFEVSKVSGLAISSSYTKNASYSLAWTKSDFARKITIPAKSDWTSGQNLKFWMYSGDKTESSFGFVVVSDNLQTIGTDYYEAKITTDFKGWKNIFIPLSEFKSCGTPAGFSNVSHIELWPVGDNYNMSASADIYFDNMYLTNDAPPQSDVKDDYVLFDLTTIAGINSSSVNSGMNIQTVKAPVTNTYSLMFTDDKKAGQKNADWMNFSKLPIKDFTPYNTLQISMYNEKISEDTIRLAVRSDNYDREGNEYYYGDISLNWEKEWKTLNFRLDKLRAVSSPLGFDQINSVQLWWFESDNANETSKTYIDKITLTNIDYSKQWESPVYTDALPQTSDHFDFASRINELYPNNIHPRLLATKSDIDWIINNKNTDPYMKAVYTKFINLCDGYAEQKTDAPDKTYATKAMNLALAYNLTNNEKYAFSCWKNIEAITVNANTWAFDNQDLTIGDVCREVAVTYDLMYNFWNDEQKMIARNAMVIYALEPFWDNLERTGAPALHETNWNPVINSGLGMAALALADTPGYEETANQYLNRIWKALGNCLKHYGPDGTSFEGPNYWNYMNGGYLPYENALYMSVGKDYYERFSALDEYGMDKTGDFITQMHGPTNLSFNFGDGSSYDCHNAGCFWLARYFNRPELAGGFYELANPGAYGIMMYRPNAEIKNWRKVMPLDYFGGGEVQAGSMRTSFEKGNQGFYVGYKGNGGNTSTHGKIDAGTFVLDALGVRFIEQLPAENYSKTGMFGSKRFEYYRNRAEGSNTLVIGPGVHQGTNTDEITDNQASEESLLDQVKQNYSPLVSKANTDNASYAVIDLSDAYRETADSVKRAYGLVDGRNAFVIQDEIQVSTPCQVYSFMHTQADIELSDDGQSAILSRYGKKLKVSLISNCNAELSVMDASPLSTSPVADNSVNSGFKKLTVSADLMSYGTFALVFTPYLGENSYSFSLNEIVPIDQWKIFLANPLQLSGISIDGVPIADFDPGKTVYNLKEDTVGTVTATAPKGIKLEITQAQSIGDTAVIKLNDGETSGAYVLTFSDDVQKRLDSINSYPPKGYLYSTGLLDIPKMHDGDVNTGWENEGSQWVAYDLGKSKPVHEVCLYWKNQNKRTETFDIKLSEDGENWVTVWEGESILSDKIESYSFTEQQARYVMVTGYKNTQNNWTSIGEFYVTFDGTNFDDITSHWAQKAIEDMAKAGLLEGTADRIYSPDAFLTRAEFITMLNRIFSVSDKEYSGSIPDVIKDDWYVNYVEGAYAEGLIPAAMLNGGFKPDANITREEIASLAVNYFEKYFGEIDGTDIGHFEDAKDISLWAVPYIEKSLAARLVTGTGDKVFEPSAYATRAQAATILKRIYIKTN